MTDIAGHLGYLLSVLGTFFVSKKDRNGFLLRILGDTIWLAIGIWLNMSSIIVWSCIFLYVDYRAYKKWVG